jgi:hypothetical protein
MTAPNWPVQFVIFIGSLPLRRSKSGRPAGFLAWQLAAEFDPFAIRQWIVPTGG